MNGRIPVMLIPLLLIAWLGQMRLCANMEGQDYARERALTKFSGLGCLLAAAGITALKFF